MSQTEKNAFCRSVMGVTSIVPKALYDLHRPHCLLEVQTWGCCKPLPQQIKGSLGNEALQNMYFTLPSSKMQYQHEIAR